MAANIFIGTTSYLNKAYRISLCASDLDIRSYKLIFARVVFNYLIILYAFGLGGILTCSVVTKLRACLGCPLLNPIDTLLSIEIVFIVWSYFDFIPSIWYFPWAMRSNIAASNALQKLVACPFH